MMKNFLNKILAKEMSFLTTYSKYLVLAVAVLGLFGTIAMAQSTNGGGSTVQGSLTAALCQVFDTVKNVIFLLGLTLMILGGALYAGANIMPGQSKGSFQGYGMSMIIGGVIGVAIAVAAPFVLNLVVNAGGNGSSFITGAVGGALC
jgi:hypothetical protein